MEIEVVGFNRQQFNSELRQIKDTIFQKATTEGISTADAVEIAESFEDEVSELVQEVADLQKSVREPATEQPTVKVTELSTVVEDQTDQRSDKAVTVLTQRLSVDPLAPQSQLEADVMRALYTLPVDAAEITPYERVLSYQPKNAYEQKVKDLTLYKYKVLDLMNHHPQATEICLQLLSAASQAWQA